MAGLRLKDRTPQNERKIISAIARAIQEMGFNAMSKQFLGEPQYRKQIVAAMAREIAKRLGPERAKQWTELCGLVVR